MSNLLKFSIIKYDFVDSDGTAEEMYEVAAVGTTQCIDDLDWEELKLLGKFIVDYIDKKEKEASNEKR